MTDVPYSLRFDDTRVDDTVFREIFSKEECDILEQKREEYISLLDPATAFRCRLRVQMRANPVSFQAPFSSKTKVPTLRPYQGLEDLEVKGKRPSRRRVDIYEMGRWLDGSMRGLEIGCNVGFFTLVVSEAVASMDAFDIDPNYIKVARFTQDFLGNRNCNFFVRSVKDFRPERAYDFVISAAVHGWSGLGFAEYGERLIRCIRPGGLMLIESHELDAEHDWPEKKRALLEKFTVLGEGVIDDVDKGMYASEMREFLVLKDKR
jgi:SAM-dependent methyltransferase